MKYTLVPVLSSLQGLVHSPIKQLHIIKLNLQIPLASLNCYLHNTTTKNNEDKAIRWLWNILFKYMKS